MTNIATILNVVFLVIIGFGFLIGLMRGLNKSLIRLITILISVLVAIWVSGSLSNAVVKIDLSSLDLLKYEGQSASTIEEFLTLMIQSAGTFSEQTLQSLITLALGLFNVVFGGVLFLVIYLVFKIISLPVFWIASLIVNSISKSRATKRGKEYKKGALWGALIGTVTGLVSFVALFAPVSGYVKVFREVDAVISQNGGESIIGENEEMGLILNGYEQSLGVQILNSTGLGGLQLEIFDAVTTANIQDVKVSLIEQAQKMGEMVSAVLDITKIDFEAYINGNSEGIVIDLDALSHDIYVILNNELVGATKDSLVPVIKEGFNAYLEQATELDPELKEILSLVVNDALGIFDDVNEQKIKDFTHGVLNVFEIASSFEGERDITEESLIKAGEAIDSIVASGFISSETVNKIIDFASEDALADLSKDYPTTYEQIKQKLNGNITSYKTEMTAFSKLLKIADISGGESIMDDGVQIGEILDEAIGAGGQIVTKDTINGLVIEIIDQTIANEQKENGNDTILIEVLNSVKQNVNDRIVSYKTEFLSLKELYDISEILSEDADIAVVGVQIGQKIDSALSFDTAVIINRQTIDKLIVKLIDDEIKKVELDPAFTDSLQTIKQGFNGDIASYETEFSAMATLYSIKDLLEGDFDFQKKASELGAVIDDALSYNAKIVNKTLVNDFIQSEIEEGVSLNEQFGKTVDTVIQRLPLEFSYEQEFKYLEKLLNISKNLSNTKIEDLDKPVIWAGESQAKTIGERLDEIAPSVLFGDCGLTVIGTALDNFAEDNQKFKSITDQIIANYQDVKQNARVCGKASGYTYDQISNAIYGVYNSIIQEGHKVTGNLQFTSELASYYESKLNEIQGNLIIGKNGARAIAEYVAGEVQQIIDGYKSSLNVPSFAQSAFNDAIDQLTAYVSHYRNYLNASLNSEMEEPFNGSQAVYVTSEKQDFSGSFSFSSQKPASATDYVRANKPFSIVFEMLEEIINVL